MDTFQRNFYHNNTFIDIGIYKLHLGKKEY